jgi:glycosyltransferase involved in cell wall biosynthesis
MPAYNEAEGVGSTLETLQSLLAELGPLLIGSEIIVVDDGSVDGTVAAVEPFLGRDMQLVRHAENRGYGAALKTGIRRARYDWILIIDADGSYHEQYIPDLLRYRNEHEMIVGARVGADVNVPLLRRPPKWFLRKLASYLCGRKIPDLNSGLRLIRKDAIERFANILPDGFSFTTTITLAMLSSGYNVKYVPIDYRKRAGKSKIRPVADTLNFLMLIFRTIMYFNPLRVFLPTAVVFFVLSLTVGVASVVLFSRLMDVTTVLLFVTGMQFLGLGLTADSLNRRLQ